MKMYDSHSTIVGVDVCDETSLKLGERGLVG